MYRVSNVVSLLLIFLCVAADAGSIRTEILDVKDQKQIQNHQKRRYPRDVIEEEKFYNKDESQKHVNSANLWMPEPYPLEDQPGQEQIQSNDKESQALFQTTEKTTEKSTSRGARASNENWIKLPFANRDDAEKDHLLPPQPSGELLNSRMPRINFVTQGKTDKDASESRDNNENNRRTNRNDELKTDFVYQGVDARARTNDKPLHARQASYFPEDSRLFLDDHYTSFNPMEDYYRSDPWRNDWYGRRRTYEPPNYSYYHKVEHYDDVQDNYARRKPKRIIYYANLPEVIRTPPSVDLRYRYSSPRNNWEEEYYSRRSGRYDHRYRTRYPYSYSSLRKENHSYRDNYPSGSNLKDKLTEKETVKPEIIVKKTPISYHMDNNDNGQFREHKSFPDVVRHDDDFLRYDMPLFQGAIDGPYRPI